MKTNTEWNVARRVVDATEVNSVITWLDIVPMAVTPGGLEKNVLTVIHWVDFHSIFVFK